MAFLYTHVLRKLSHLKSGTQIAINKGTIPSQAHISEGKRPGLFQALKRVGRPKAYTKSVYWLFCRALKASSGVEASLDKARKAPP